MTELIALGVYGDAFVHRRSNGTMLIDGGGSAAMLGRQLAAELPTVSHLDIVVCTHADLDHANGLRTILVDWEAATKAPVSIGEFWLPGRWMDIARRGLSDPKAMMHDLIRSLDEGRLEDARLLLWSEDDGDADGHDADEGAPPVSVERLVEGLGRPDAHIRVDDHEARSGRRELDHPPHPAAVPMASDDPEPDVDTDECDTPFEPDWLRDLREGRDLPSDEELTRRFENARSRVVYRMGLQPNLLSRGLPRRVGTTETTGRYCLALIDTAEAIVRIARHAIDEKVAIRWFDQDEYAKTLRPAGGRTGFLLPMNSMELKSMPVAETRPLVLYASLSRANRESLAFYSPAEPDCHGVVFCADSRLGTGRGGAVPFKSYPTMLLSRQVGTAPHHAAESAARAYAHSAKFGITDWVCAANGRTGPGPTFRGIAGSRRCCTACPLIGRPLRAVVIDLKDRKFAMPATCTCR